MRLAATEEAADPSAPLISPAQIVDERANDFLDAVRVLPFADEGRKLTVQFQHGTFVLTIRDACLALVDERMGRRVTLQNVFDFHAYPPSPWSVIGTAR